jgi:DNA (cytosine-5)-methyltransferase 1
MENVKGVLSSRVEGRYIFEEILGDLSSLGGGKEQAYELMALKLDEGRIRLERATRPTDFIVRAEEHGVPQRRHRVIIIGIRSDHVERALDVSIEVPTGEVTVNAVIGDLPRLRSGLSRSEDTPHTWRQAVADAADELRCLHEKAGQTKLATTFGNIRQALNDDAPQARRSKRLPRRYGRSNDPLRQWLERPMLRAVAQHETRAHMASDLARYMFASTFGRVKRRSAKKDDYPSALAPDHRSWERGVFSDRFRTQLAGEPSTTIVSHIAKDGHYFIHPDPLQCRSLTVREAARLQTFPDDYMFLGNRTQQYVQVGNAVPPYLARQLAILLFKVLGDSGTASPSDASSSREEVEVSVPV